MSIETSDIFKSDTGNTRQNVIPLVVIYKNIRADAFETIDSITDDDKLFLSTQNIYFDGNYYEPLLQNIPDVKETLDLETKKYRIQSSGLSISNVSFHGRKFSSNIKDILNSSDANHLYGVVLGRTDFIQSFGFTKDKVDSDECFKMAVEIFTLAKKKGLKKVMGGNLNINSFNFIKNLYDKKLLDYIETRNVKVKLSDGFLNNFKENLSSMLEFESEWLTCKYDDLTQLSKDDKKRLDNLKLRNTE